jgi:hypothetical protein
MSSNRDKTDYSQKRAVLLALQWNGPMRVLSMDSQRPYPWSVSDTKVLLHTTEGLEPGYEMFVQLLCDDEGIFTRADQPNRHIWGLKGTAFINVVVDYLSPEPENDDDVGADETFVQGQRIPHALIARVFESLKWQQDMRFSQFHGYFQHVLTELVNKYRAVIDDGCSHLLEELDALVLSFLEDVEHPHIERTTVGASMLTPSHPDIMIKSLDALKYAINCIMNLLKEWASASGLMVAVEWLEDTIPHNFPATLPNPSHTCEEFGRRIQPLVARLYEDYFRRLDASEESEAEANRRKDEAERRDLEAAAKRAAQASARKERILRERIARLEVETNRPLPTRGRQRLPQKGSAGRVRTAEEQAVHDHHVSEEDKARRSAVWEARQQLAQLAAETKRLETAYSELHDEQERQGAAAALRNHVIPPLPNLAGFVPDV